MTVQRQTAQTKILRGVAPTDQDHEKWYFGESRGAGSRKGAVQTADSGWGADNTPLGRDGGSWVNGYGTDWYLVARQAWYCYLVDSIVRNCIDCWRDFAVGDPIQISVSDPALQDVIMPLKDATLTRDSLAYRLGLTNLVRDMVLQVLVKGMAWGHKRYTEDHTDIADVSCLNPVSIHFDRDPYTRALTSIEQWPENEDNENNPGSQATNTIQFPAHETDADHFLCIKWGSIEYADFGNPMLRTAFRDVRLRMAYREAEFAIAKRWAEPIQLLQIGGCFGDRVINPDENMLKAYAAAMHNRPKGHAMTVPWYVNLVTYGAEGEVLEIEKKILSCESSIMVACGMPKSLVTGEGSNFATAKIGLRKLLVMISYIKQIAKVVLDWVLLDWMALKDVHGVSLSYPGLDISPDDDAEQKKLLSDLRDRGLVSRETMQRRFDLDPETEEANLANEGFALTNERYMTPLIRAVELGILTPDEVRGIASGQKVVLKPLPGGNQLRTATPAPAPAGQPDTEGADV